MKKNYCLTLCDLVSSLFSLLMERNYEINELTYHQIMEFGDVVCEEAKRRGLNVYILTDRERTANFFYYNKDTFKEVEINGYKGVGINEGVTPVHLHHNYIIHIPLELVFALEDDKVADRTLKMMGFDNPNKRESLDIDKYILQLENILDGYIKERDFDKCKYINKRLNELYSVKKDMENIKEENSSFVKKHAK